MKRTGGGRLCEHDPDAGTEAHKKQAGHGHDRQLLLSTRTTDEACQYFLDFSKHPGGTKT